MDHKDFEVDASYCTGGQWILPNTDIMQFFVYSTKRLNLTLVHRDGDVNELRAKMILKDVQHIVENVSMLSDNDTCFSSSNHM